MGIVDTVLAETELVEISAGEQGVPAFLGRSVIDTHRTHGHAAGPVANLIQPRMFLTTHMPFAPYLNEETVAEVCDHRKGPYHCDNDQLVVPYDALSPGLHE